MLYSIYLVLWPILLSLLVNPLSYRKKSNLYYLAIPKLGGLTATKYIAIPNGEAMNPMGFKQTINECDFCMTRERLTKNMENPNKIAKEWKGWPNSG